MYKHILIPTDGSALSEMAIEHGVTLAKTVGAKVTGITVFPEFRTFAAEPMIVTDTPEEYEKDCEALGTKYLSAVQNAAATAGVSYKVMRVTRDDPYAAIIDAATVLGCDLIVMASHGRRGIKAFVLGSETTKVLTHSKIPVLVCR